MLFHELGNDAIERFLAIDHVAMSSVGRVKDGGEELMEARKAARTSMRAGPGAVGPCRMVDSLEEGLQQTASSR